MRAQAKLWFAGLALAAGLAHAGDDYEQARVAYERGDYARAHDKLLAEARKGDAEAQELLAFMYAFGPQLYPGVARDLTAAAQLFDRAARSGRPTARLMYCALARRGALHFPKEVYCFDRIAQTGQPPLRPLVFDRTDR